MGIVLGVPSSAGAHTPGLEEGPAAIRDAGLIDLLRGGVVDHGDVMAFRWSPRFAALVLTEINPDHAPDPGVLRDFVAVLTNALAEAR